MNKETIEPKILSGVNIITITTLMFVYLKLTDSISWNWIFVLSPLIISEVYVIIMKTIIVYKANQLKKRMNDFANERAKKSNLHN
jgi:hypothetical protein